MKSASPVPRILLLTDKCNWAFHTIAGAIAFHLSDRYDFTILAADEAPAIDCDSYDILHVFGADQTYHHLFPRKRAKVLKGIYSHLWLKHHFSKEELYDLHLRDADAVTVPSLLLLQELQNLPVPTYLFPEGVDTGTFTPAPPREGPLVAGWAGDPADPLKQVHLARQACAGICELRMATGSLSLREMTEFYRSIDVLICTSSAEGCPRPVLEAMACGRYVVAFPVGIVPEVICEPLNGIVVRENTVQHMRHALQTCVDHPESVRQTRLSSEYIRAHRQWRSVVWHVADAYDALLRG